MDYRPPEYSYMKTVIEFIISIEVKESVIGCIYELYQFRLVFNTKLIYSLNISFSHNICCYFSVCNHFNFFIDQKSQLARFLTWNILIVDNCVKSLLRKLLCLVDSNSMWYIGLIYEPLLIIIWGEGSFPYKPMLLSQIILK